MRWISLLIVGLALGGCGGLDRGEPNPGSSPEVDRADRDVILGWVDALDTADYQAAAEFFAPDAIVEQAVVLRLRSRADAVAFNRSLPCRAELTDLEPVPERGPATLAAFRLLEGPGRRCGQAVGGGARVLFVVEDELITEWRQLPDAPEDPGDVI